VKTELEAVIIHTTTGLVIPLCPSVEGYVGCTYEEVMGVLRQHETVKGKTILTETLEPGHRVAIPWHAVAMVTEGEIERG
jgi:hypothetical protein